MIRQRKATSRLESETGNGAVCIPATDQQVFHELLPGSDRVLIPRNPVQPLQRLGNWDVLVLVAVHLAVAASQIDDRA